LTRNGAWKKLEGETPWDEKKIAKFGMVFYYFFSTHFRMTDESQTEQWKDIPIEYKCPGYEISDLGNVRHKETLDGRSVLC
jgi:hypothetical protein